MMRAYVQFRAQNNSFEITPYLLRTSTKIMKASKSTQVRWDLKPSESLLAGFWTTLCGKKIRRAVEYFYGAQMDE